MCTPAMTLGTSLGSGETADRYAPPLLPEEQKLRDAEKERIWAAIMADSQR